MAETCFFGLFFHFLLDFVLNLVQLFLCCIVSLLLRIESLADRVSVAQSNICTSCDRTWDVSDHRMANQLEIVLDVVPDVFVALLVGAEAEHATSFRAFRAVAPADRTDWIRSGLTRRVAKTRLIFHACFALFKAAEASTLRVFAARDADVPHLGWAAWLAKAAEARKALNARLVVPEAPFLARFPSICLNARRLPPSTGIAPVLLALPAKGAVIRIVFRATLPADRSDSEVISFTLGIAEQS